MGSLFDGAEHLVDGADHAFPAGHFGGQLFASDGGEAIVAGFSVVLGGAPEGSDPAAVFEAVEGGVKGAVLYQ
jgi:hypothetical protein